MDVTNLLKLIDRNQQGVSFDMSPMPMKPKVFEEITGFFLTPAKKTQAKNNSKFQK